MVLTLIGAAEFDQLLAYIQQLGNQVNALQTAIQSLQADVSSLSSAVTADAANKFTDADVANIQAIDAQVKGLLATLTPAAPMPPATPAS